MKLTEIFELAASRQASDIHLATGEAPRLRIDGALVALDEAVDLPTLLEPLLTPEAAARLGAGMPVERTLVHGGLAFVAIVFRVGETGLAATFRILSSNIPALDVIGEDALPLLRRLVDAPRGLVLIAGPTGSGKWTTACALTDAINSGKAARIFVVEAHPNHLFESKKALVSQLHVGQDCENYSRALEIAHHADLDVVAMDDIPTLDALRQALVLADTGHLVIANLNAPTAAQAIARLVESAGPDEAALRRALADNLLVVTAQRLVPGLEGRGRVPVYEWITNNAAVKSALLAGDDLSQVQESDDECLSFAQAARDLYTKGKIALESTHRFTKDLPTTP